MTPPRLAIVPRGRRHWSGRGTGRAPTDTWRCRAHHPAAGRSATLHPAGRAPWGCPFRSRWTERSRCRGRWRCAPDCRPAAPAPGFRRKKSASPACPLASRRCRRPPPAPWPAPRHARASSAWRARPPDARGPRAGGRASASTARTRCRGSSRATSRPSTAPSRMQRESCRNPSRADRAISSGRNRRGEAPRLLPGLDRRLRGGRGSRLTRRIPPTSPRRTHA